MCFRTRDNNRHFMVMAVVFVLTGCLVMQRLELRADNPVPAVQKARPAPLAERPWVTAWVSSLARAMAACDVVYESVNRHDLSETLEDRLTEYRAFRGIDRTRPLGMMWTWDDVNDPPNTIFLPIAQIDELMKTATFDVVDFHKVNENRYEIERPGSPYHVLIHAGYALFGEEIPAMQALRESPERVTRDLRDKYDVVLLVDQKQVPRASKQLWVDVVRSKFEPWMQPQDDEPVESAALRRTLGMALLDLIERLVLDTRTLTLAARLDGRTHQIQIDLTVQAESGSRMAAELNHLIVRKSEFSALVHRGAAAGMAISIPLTLIGRNESGATGEKVSRVSRLDAGMQIVGETWNDTAFIAGMRGSETAALIAAMPYLLKRMEQSQQFAEVTMNVDSYRGIRIHRVVPVNIPEVLQSVLRPGIELLIGQGTDTVWFAAGNPASLLDRLQRAVNAVKDTSGTEPPPAVVQGRLSAGKFPSIFPTADDARVAGTIPAEKADDGFSLVVQPVTDGLKVRLTVEEGLLRMLGRYWAEQVDVQRTPQ
jgi:hypothetical protein